jgi:hypothetical protein
MQAQFWLEGRVHASQFCNPELVETVRQSPFLPNFQISRDLGPIYDASASPARTGAALG